MSKHTRTWKSNKNKPLVESLQLVTGEPGKSNKNVQFHKAFPMMQLFSVSKDIRIGNTVYFNATKEYLKALVEIFEQSCDLFGESIFDFALSPDFSNINELPSATKRFTVAFTFNKYPEKRTSDEFYSTAIKIIHTSYVENAIPIEHCPLFAVAFRVLSNYMRGDISKIGNLSCVIHDFNTKATNLTEMAGDQPGEESENYDDLGNLFSSAVVYEESENVEMFPGGMDEDQPGEKSENVNAESESANQPGGVEMLPGGTGDQPGGTGDQPGGVENNPGGTGDQPGGVENNPGGVYEDQPGGVENNPGGMTGDEPGGTGDQPGVESVSANQPGGVADGLDGMANRSTGRVGHIRGASEVPGISISKDHQQTALPQDLRPNALEFSKEPSNYGTFPSISGTSTDDPGTSPAESAESTDDPYIPYIFPESLIYGKESGTDPEIRPESDYESILDATHGNPDARGVLWIVVDNKPKLVPYCLNNGVMKIPVEYGNVREFYLTYPFAMGFNTRVFGAGHGLLANIHIMSKKVFGRDVFGLDKVVEACAGEKCAGDNCVFMVPTWKEKSGGVVSFFEIDVEPHFGDLVHTENLYESSVVPSALEVFMDVMDKPCDVELKEELEAMCMDCRSYMKSVNVRADVVSQFVWVNDPDNGYKLVKRDCEILPYGALRLKDSGGSGEEVHFNYPIPMDFIGVNLKVTVGEMKMLALLNKISIEKFGRNVFGYGMPIGVDKVLGADPEKVWHVNVNKFPWAGAFGTNLWYVFANLQVPKDGVETCTLDDIGIFDTAVKVLKRYAMGDTDVDHFVLSVNNVRIQEMNMKRKLEKEKSEKSAKMPRAEFGWTVFDGTSNKPKYEKIDASKKQTKEYPMWYVGSFAMDSIGRGLLYRIMYLSINHVGKDIFGLLQIFENDTVYGWNTAILVEPAHDDFVKNGHWFPVKFRIETFDVVPPLLPLKSFPVFESAMEVFRNIEVASGSEMEQELTEFYRDCEYYLESESEKPKSENDPGDGYVWIKHDDGSLSLVHTSQLNTNDFCQTFYMFPIESGPTPRIYECDDREIFLLFKMNELSKQVFGRNVFGISREVLGNKIGCDLSRDIYLSKLPNFGPNFENKKRLLQISEIYGACGKYGAQSWYSAKVLIDSDVIQSETYKLSELPIFKLAMITFAKFGGDETQVAQFVDELDDYLLNLDDATIRPESHSTDDSDVAWVVGGDRPVLVSCDKIKYDHSLGYAGFKQIRNNFPTFYPISTKHEHVRVLCDFAGLNLLRDIESASHTKYGRNIFGYTFDDEVKKLHLPHQKYIFDFVPCFGGGYRISFLKGDEKIQSAQSQIVQLEKTGILYAVGEVFSDMPIVDRVRNYLRKIHGVVEKSPEPKSENVVSEPMFAERECDVVYNMLKAGYKNFDRMKPVEQFIVTKIFNSLAGISISQMNVPGATNTLKIKRIVSDFEDYLERVPDEFEHLFTEEPGVVQEYRVFSETLKNNSTQGGGEHE